jgi:hypothetical protein
MKARLIILFCILNCCVLNGQHALGVRAGIGSSLLTTIFHSSNEDEKQFFWPQVTGSGGIFYSYTFQNGLIIHTDPNYFYMRGKETMNFEAIDQNGPTGTFVYNTLWRNFHTVALPINVGLNAGRWMYLLGGQANYYFKRNGREKGNWTEPNGVVHEWENFAEEEDFGTKKYDYGISAGVIYNYNDRLSFDARAFAGLNNLSNGSISESWKWKVYLVTFGCSYALYKSSPAVIAP